MARLRLDIWISILLAVLTVAAFVPVLGNDFVNYDDPSLSTRLNARPNQPGIIWACPALAAAGAEDRPAASVFFPP